MKCFLSLDAWSNKEPGTASAKVSCGTSLNDQLLIGPTLHPPLVDVVIRFCQHRIALTTDVSRLYRKDYRMTRLTFGVSASCSAANMAVKQNAIDFSKEYHRAASIVSISFYVDNSLTEDED